MPESEAHEEEEEDVHNPIMICISGQHSYFPSNPLNTA